MPITIKKEKDYIKFYGSQEDPITVIYNDDTPQALINYVTINNQKIAKEVSDAAMIASLFVNSILMKNDSKFMVNNIDVVYFNEGDLSMHEASYSARKILYWVESGKIVTVNKKERIRYEFTKFSYENGKLVIFYKPIAW